MLASITPLGERGRHNRWSLTAGAYEAGSVLGGAAIGALAGTLGWLTRLAGLRPAPAVLAAAAALVCVAAVALDLWRSGAAIPTVHRQVDEDWLVRYRGWVYGGGFGLQLGFGVVTIVTTAAVYAMLALAAIAQSVAIGAVAGAVFGATRGLPLVLQGRARDLGAIRQARRRLEARADGARLLSAGALSAAAVVLVAGAVR